MSTRDSGQPASERGADDIEFPQAKRQKLDGYPKGKERDEDNTTNRHEPILTGNGQVDSAVEADALMGRYGHVEVLVPPSRALLGERPTSTLNGSSEAHLSEFDVGISEYISKDLPPIHAIIKQRRVPFC